MANQKWKINGRCNTTIWYQSISIKRQKSIDICYLNSGGIRSILPKGNVTARDLLKLCLLKNSLVVIALKGEQIEMVNFFIAEKKPHP